VLLLPFVEVPLTTLVLHPAAVAVCVPTTALGLWGIHRMQRYRRLPAWLLLAVFGWGVLIAAGFAYLLNNWYTDYAPAHLANTINPADPGAIAQLSHDFKLGLFAHAAIIEELGKVAGVAAAVLLFRKHIDGVVSGVVLGAAVGLGFNLSETLDYMSGPGSAYQYFARQGLTLLAGHTAFAALAGAGIGVARQLAEPRLRRIAISGGLIGAIGGHFANNVLLAWYNSDGRSWLHPSPTVDALALQPLMLIILQGPVVAMYLILLRQGLRSQAGGLGDQLRAEAATGLGAVTQAEVPILLTPTRRLWLKIALLRGHGPGAWQAAARLHAAQFDLAAHRWHRARWETAEPPEREPLLRERVLRRKQHLVQLITTPKQQPEPVGLR